METILIQSAAVVGLPSKTQDPRRFVYTRDQNDKCGIIYYHYRAYNRSEVK